METPLRPVRRAGRWLRHLAAVTLLGYTVAGCTTFVDPTTQAAKDQGSIIAQTPVTDKDKKPAADPKVVQAKSDGHPIDWPDWEWEDFDLFGLLPKSAPQVPPSDAVVLQGDGLTPVKAPPPGAVEARMALAQERYAAKDYVRALKIFHRIAENEKNPQQLVQDAKFFEAECYYLQDNWPKAAETYMDLMNKFPRNKYRETALTRMFEIADFWLEDTRLSMRQYKEKEDGLRWYVPPHFVTWEDKKPFLDEEGRAVQLLEAVRFGDINSPRADQALFLCGSIKFFDEDYKDADYYFTQLSQKHNNRSEQAEKMAENATRLAIIAKHLSTGGADYDGRKGAEARILVQEALDKYPNLNKDKFLDNQIVSITKEQAEKDFKMGEFYERTGHPGAAVWQYDLVIRRYHGFEPYASDAAKRRAEILQKMEKEGLAEPQPTAHKQEPQLEPAPVPRGLPTDLGPGR